MWEHEMTRFFSIIIIIIYFFFKKNNIKDHHSRPPTPFKKTNKTKNTYICIHGEPRQRRFEEREREKKEEECQQHRVFPGGHPSKY